MKIAIIGHSASGKSTLAKQLANFYHAPVMHLDRIHFSGSWDGISEVELEDKIKEFACNNNSWVIEGNYSKSYPERFKEADLVIFLNYNRFYCFIQALKRYYKYKGQVRDDLGLEEKMDFEFIEWILYKGRKRSKIMKLKSYVNDAKKGYIFKNRRQLHRYLSKNSIPFTK